jgi:RHS repeat-associated protein
MGCIKLDILDKQYRKSELKESSPKNELTFNFCDKNVRKESVLYYFVQRYQDPEMGIFNSRDELFEKQPFMSPYAYCNNSPIVYVDPDGRTPWRALVEGQYYSDRSGGNAFTAPNMRVNPVDKVPRPHQGIDLGGGLKGGERVFAAAEGTVSFVSKKESKSAGWYMEIDHGNGYVSKYMHLKEKPNFKKGDAVSNEQVIGKVGNTGRTTKDKDGKGGNHLHFEIWQNGQPIDPTSIYDLQEIINPNNIGTKGYGYEGMPPIQLKGIEVKDTRPELEYIPPKSIMNLNLE